VTGLRGTCTLVLPQASKQRGFMIDGWLHEADFDRLVRQFKKNTQSYSGACGDGPDWRACWGGNLGTLRAMARSRSARARVHDAVFGGLSDMMTKVVPGWTSS